MSTKLHIDEDITPPPSDRVYTFVRVRGTQSFPLLYNHRYNLDIKSNTTMKIKYNSKARDFTNENIDSTKKIGTADRYKDTLPNIKYDMEVQFGPFNHIFDGISTNEHIATSNSFNPIIAQLIAGIPVCIVGYGPSGSGKTSTLVYFEAKGEQGIMGTIVQKLGEVGFTSCKITPIELINDITNDETALNQYATQNGYRIANCLTNNTINYNYKYNESKRQWKNTGCEDTMLNNILDLLKMRTTAGTTNNPQSSRGHLILKIVFNAKTNANLEITETTLILCDFAGIENDLTCDTPQLDEMLKLTNIVVEGDTKTEIPAYEEAKKALDEAERKGTEEWERLTAEKKTRDAQNAAANEKNKANVMKECKERVSKLLEEKILIFLHNWVLIRGDIPKNPKIKWIQWLSPSENDILLRINVDNYVNFKYENAANPSDEKLFNSIQFSDTDVRYDIKNEYDTYLVQNRELIATSKGFVQSLGKEVGTVGLDDNEIISFNSGRGKRNHFLPDNNPANKENIINYIVKQIDSKIKNDLGHKKITYYCNPSTITNAQEEKIEDLQFYINKYKTTAYKLIKQECDKRAKEGKYINKSLAELREFIGGILKQSAQNAPYPPFIPDCIPYQCNPDYRDCFGIQNPLLMGGGASVSETIMKDVFNKDEMVFCIFTVINLSRDNEPPVSPYINMQPVQSAYEKLMTYKKFTPFILNSYSKNNSNLITSFIEEQAKIINNHLTELGILTEGFAYLSRTDIQFFHKNVSVSQRQKIYDVAQEIVKPINRKHSFENWLGFIADILSQVNAINATSTLGVLQFTDMISKYGSNPNMCVEN